MAPDTNEERAPTLLVVLFFASGIAGLVYEVSWVRQLGNVFGNTVYSAAFVTAVFMLGLGIGSGAAGGWADRRTARPHAARALYRAYAFTEIGIALFGIVLALLLPRLGAFAASSYTTDARGWSEPSMTASYAIATVLVLPPTLLMGATLTLLVRATLVRGIALAGYRIGLLYGANTVGAAVGALACDALLVPSVGVFRTQLVAAAINVTVGAAAFLLSRRRLAEAKEDEHEPAREKLVWSRTLTGACISLALSGFAALGMEIVWFRFLSATLGAFRAIFSLVLAVILVGIWLGAFASAALVRKLGARKDVLTVTQALAAIFALGSMAFFQGTITESYAGAAKAIVSVVALPAIAMGFAFPLVNAIVQDRASEVARKTGALYLANTLGSIAGSLFAGFVLAPAIGSQTSFGIFAACAALAPLALVPPRRALVATAAAAIAVVAWLALPQGILFRRFMPGLPPPEKIVDLREGPNEIVAVVERPLGLQLMTNGHPMSGTSIPAQRYMRAFAHVPLLMQPDPKRALVICFGVGSTLHATSLHPSLERIEIADLSRNVLEHASFFEANNHRVLEDRRVAVFVEDGRQHLRAAPPGTYDLVTLEPPPILFAGVSALYSHELYDLAKSRLAPGGLMTQWLPIYDAPPEIGLSLVRTFLDVFPTAVLLSGWGNELILLGAKDGAPLLDLDAVEAALAERPEVAKDLARVHLGTLTDLATMFVADGEALARMTSGSPILTDDRPFLEYTFGRPTEIARVLFGSVSAIERYCPKCIVDGQPDPRLVDLKPRLAVLERLYLTEHFRKNVLPFTVSGAQGRAETIAKSDYLSRLVAPK